MCMLCGLKKAWITIQYLGKDLHASDNVLMQGKLLTDVMF